jgi:hypothetical protein
MRSQGRAALTIMTVALAITGVAGCGAATHQHTRSSPATVSARTGAARHALSSTIVAYALARPDLHEQHLTARPLQENRQRTRPTITATTLPHRSSHSRGANHRTPVAPPTGTDAHASKAPLARHHIAARALKPSVSSSKDRLVEQTITLPQRSRAKRRSGSASTSAKRIHRTSNRATHAGQGSSAATEHGKSSNQPNERARGAAVELTSVNPCTYVRRAQVASALRVGSVSAREAPLGPTCVFTAGDRTKGATLSIQVGTLPSERRRMRRLIRTRVGGHPAYCGTLGQPLLLVKLSRYYVLSVAAPCDAARAVARAALHRIKA